MTICRLIGLILLLCTTPGFAREVRTWHGNNGVKIQAELFELRGDQVVLRPADGKPDIVTQLTNLSAADQAYVKSQLLAPDSTTSEDIHDGTKEVHWGPFRDHWPAWAQKLSTAGVVVVLAVFFSVMVLTQVWSLMLAARMLGAPATMGESLRAFFIRAAIWTVVLVGFAFVKPAWLIEKSLVTTLGGLAFDSLLLGVLFNRGIFAGLAINLISTVISAVTATAVLWGVALLF